jgi:hypothetical protein
VIDVRPAVGVEGYPFVDRKAHELGLRASAARQASGRRRGVDPTTCDRDYTRDEVEFMLAMQEYKRTSGRPFPTWTEALEVLRSLGYTKGGSDQHG